MTLQDVERYLRSQYRQFPDQHKEENIEKTVSDFRIRYLLGEAIRDKDIDKVRKLVEHTDGKSTNYIDPSGVPLKGPSFLYLAKKYHNEEILKLIEKKFKD